MGEYQIKTTLKKRGDNLIRLSVIKRVVTISTTYLLVFVTVIIAQVPTDDISYNSKKENNFLVGINEPIKFADIQIEEVDEYVNITMSLVDQAIKSIKEQKNPTFDNVFRTFDDAVNNLDNARNMFRILSSLSPESQMREHSFRAKTRLDSLSEVLFSDPAIADQMTAFSKSEYYHDLDGPGKMLVDYLVESLSFQPTETTKKLWAENRQLERRFDDLNDPQKNIVVLNEEEVEGLPGGIKKRYAKGGGRYEIPNIGSVGGIVMATAKNEHTRKAFFKGAEKVTEEKLSILEKLVKNRYQTAKLEGYGSYAEMRTDGSMAGNPEVIWEFINQLLEDTREATTQNIEKLQQVRNQETGIESSEPIQPWNLFYYAKLYNQLHYKVTPMALKPYLSLDNCLEGMFDLYEQLLGFRFVKVENPSVWHPDVQMYRVMERDSLKALFYLDLYGRSRKSSGAYVSSIKKGKSTAEGYQVPVSVLVTNFIKPSELKPTLLMFPELRTLFHEFGHVMASASYDGEFAYLASSKRDFNEAMSQMFENWLNNYEIVSSFALHHKTGEVLPQELFEQFIQSTSISDGIRTQVALGNAMYDLMLYDRYNPESNTAIDEYWKTVDEKTVISRHDEGFYPVKHFFTHPVYYYSYVWSDVYAKDMFSVFKENGLRDQRTGIRYRNIILANGKQRDIDKALEEFLGRPSNNKAFINSLGAGETN